MNITQLTSIALYLNGAAGSGKYDDIQIAIVKAHIGAGTIFDFLDKKLGEDIALAHYSKEELADLRNEWLDMTSSLAEGHSLSVDRGGLTLLVAYLLIGIKRRAPASS